jgi:hypothetical protein
MANTKNSKEDDCGCGKPLKINDPRRKNAGVKKIIKKKSPK